MNSLFEIDQLACSYDKHYREGLSRVVLEIDHLSIPRGHKVFIVGESGIGKSTILETLGMMNNTIVPGRQTRFVFTDADGRQTDLAALWHQGGDARLSAFRQRHYSFIFQSTNLMRNFTAYENIAFTRMLQGYSRKESFERTRQTLADLGLEHVSQQRMAQELSGGQQQRLAFARAILPDFDVLFGDEPTGNLDAENAAKVMTILTRKLDQQQGASAIIVSHDMHLATSFADIIIKIRKETRPGRHADDDLITYGHIDHTCIYKPADANRQQWTNSLSTMQTEEFEDYLRKK